MRNIIVVAYQLHYSKGSECAVAWDYITHMNKNNHLTVIYGSSAGHHSIGDTKAMEDYTRANDVENVTFIPVKPSFPLKKMDYSLIGTLKFYKAYRNWHKDVKDVVSKLIKESHYDIIHFLGPIGYHEPGFLFDMPVPYIWGPIGGLGQMPNRLVLQTQKRWGGVKCQVFIKQLFNYLRMHFNTRVKKALSNADVVIGCTTEIKGVIQKLVYNNHHSKIEYLPENCISHLHDINYAKFNSEVINMIFVGRLDIMKAPMIVLEALSRLGTLANGFHVVFLGAGPMQEKYKEFIHINDLENIVTLKGQVERSEVFSLMSNAQMMLLTSLMDANTTVVWEAMSHAVPVLSLDHCGMHDTIKEESGIKIPLGTYDEVVNSITEVFRKLVERPELLKEMAENLLKDREAYTWERRSVKFDNLYALAEKQFEERGNYGYKTEN